MHMENAGPKKINKSEQNSQMKRTDLICVLAVAAVLQD